MRPRVALGLVALEHRDLQREPVGADQQTDGDLRVDAVFLGPADLTQVVLVGDLEMQGLCRCFGYADVMGVVPCQGVI